MKYERKDSYSKPYTAADVLKLALAKEESSYKFYEEVMKKTASPELKRLLTELKNAEWGHIQKIKHKLEK